MKYHKHIVSEFPEKTLSLFKQSIDKYVDSTGRDIYEETVRVFKCMLKIEGGKESANQMISTYRDLYKNRKAMIEIMNRFCKEEKM